MHEIFISYRRMSVPNVDHFHQKLALVVSETAIFLDREDIAPGSPFPARLEEAMSGAQIVLVFIGSKWISEQDPKTYQRRLDMREDWVRREIEQALEEGKRIIPVLIEGAEVPTPEQLPDSLRPLVDFGSVTLSVERFAVDADQLVLEIAKQLSVEQVAQLSDSSDGKWPPIPGFVPQPLDDEQLKQLQVDLPQWQLVESDLVDDDRFGPGYQRRELVRSFRFNEFKDAVLFMAKASESIDMIGHHPRWENVFKTVTVHFSTWDIGHRPSDRDNRAAANVEKQYENFIRELGRGVRYKIVEDE